MNIIEKNKRLLNVAQTSQWKIVPKPDEQADDVQIANHRDEQVIRPIRQDAGQRLLRDATAFYKNDTSNFLGELQKVETSLSQRTTSVSKVDFLPPKRKTSCKENQNASLGKGIGDLLSDTDVVAIPRAKLNGTKNEEPEKLIVDVKDFVETFSVFREPVYLHGNRKSQPEPEVKTEVESLLDKVQLRRENDKTHFTIESATDSSLDHDVCDESTESMTNPDNHTNPHGIVLPVVEGTIQDVVTHNSSTTTYGIVNNQCELRSEVSAESEYTGQLVVDTLSIMPLKEVKELPKRDAVRHVEEQPIPEAVIPKKIERKKAKVETKPLVETVPDPVSDEQSHVTSVRMKDVFARKIKHSTESHSIDPKLPGILERLEDIAGDQCDSLANYIKDKVYDGKRLIAFCGMKRGGGCSTMTLLAAKGITRHGLKTAVIDANFEFPQLNAIVTGQQNEQENQASWVNTLHGTVEWETLGITPKDMPLLTVFPLTENALVNWSQHEPERLQQETNRLLSTLHDHFDIILLDCGCFEDAFEEITWGELALFQPDDVILIRNPKETPLELLEPCCREILGSGIGACGVAENFVA